MAGQASGARLRRLVQGCGLDRAAPTAYRSLPRRPDLLDAALPAFSKPLVGSEWRSAPCQKPRFGSEWRSTGNSLEGVTLWSGAARVVSDLRLRRLALVRCTAERGPGQPNSPASTLPRKARYWAWVTARTGPAGSLESRIATRPGSSATSTQFVWSLPPTLRLLFRQVARDRSDARTVLSSVVLGGHNSVAIHSTRAAESCGLSASDRSRSKTSLYLRTSASLCTCAALTAFSM